MSDVLERFRGALIVSCQVNRDEPVYHIRYRNRYLFRLHFVLAMAKSAELGGARGLRVENPLYIRRVREFVDLPVIGLVKRRYPGSDVYITPTLRDAVRVAEAGADVVAVDATHRPRPRGGSLETIVRELKRRYDVLLLADVSTLEEGVMAERMGFDMVATTLAGYTPYSRRTPGPDFELIRELSSTLKVPVLAEGRIRSPRDAAMALEAGAYAVVVGSAITRPYLTVRWYVEEINRVKKGGGVSP